MITVSYSELSTYQRCPRAWQVEYLWRLRKDSGPGAASLGTLIHAALEELYRPDSAPFHRAEMARAAVAESDDPRREDAERIIEDYIEWAREQNSAAGWQPVAVEQKFEVPLPREGYSLKGSIDLVVRDAKGRILIVDHKSSAMKYPDDLNWWPQGLGYVYAWNYLHPDDKAYAMVWNGLNTKNPPVRPTTPWEPFRRVWGTANEQDALTNARNMAEEARNAYVSYGEAKAPIRPSKTNCRWCPFQALCEKDRRYPLTEEQWRESLLDDGFVHTPRT